DPQPLVIGAEEIHAGEVIVREDPCHAGTVVAAAYAATAEDVTRAVAAAKDAAGPWRRTPYAERVAMLRAAREDVAGQIAELAAVVSAETGKTRLEAV